MIMLNSFNLYKAGRHGGQPLQSNLQKMSENSFSPLNLIFLGNWA